MEYLGFSVPSYWNNIAIIMSDLENKMESFSFVYSLTAATHFRYYLVCFGFIRPFIIFQFPSLHRALHEELVQHLASAVLADVQPRRIFNSG